MLWMEEEKKVLGVREVHGFTTLPPGLPIFGFLLCERINPYGLSHWGQLSATCS